jgi:hypothetical protein
VRRGLLLMATMLGALLLGSGIAFAAEIIGTNGGDTEPPEAPQTAHEQPGRGEPQTPIGRPQEGSERRSLLSRLFRSYVRSHARAPGRW